MIEAFELSKDDRGRLVLKRDGQEDVQDVRVRRVFPLTHMDHYVSIRSGEGKELILIDDLGTLDANQRRVIEEVLNGTSFVPQIQRVDDVDVRFGYQQWKVQTDRGPAEFRV